MKSTNLKIFDISDRASDLASLLGRWSDEQNRVQRDGGLSETGRKQKLATLTADYAAKVETAGRGLFAALADEQAARRATYAQWATMEQTAWDYQRLGLVRETLQARLVALGNDPAGIRAMYEADTATGDLYTQRAWMMSARALAKEYENKDTQSLAYELSRRLTRAIDPELAHMETQIASQNVGVRAHEIRVRANDALGGQPVGMFGSAGAGPLSDVLNKLQKKTTVENGGITQWVEVQTES